MSTISDNVSLNSADADEISLYDIWKKLVQYKKVFWAIFFTVFVIGVCLVLLTPTKYNFSQIIEIGGYDDGAGNVVRFMDLKTANNKIIKILLPQAVHAYNLQSKQKISGFNRRILIDGTGDGYVILSTNGTLKEIDLNKFIFQQIMRGLVDENVGNIDKRIKNMGELKVILEGLFAKRNADVNSSAPKNTNNKNLYTDLTVLANNISRLNMQVSGTYNTHAVSDFTISDEPLPRARLASLVLYVMAAFFLACFGVFVVNFVAKFRRYNP